MIRKNVTELFLVPFICLLVVCLFSCQTDSVKENAESQSHKGSLVQTSVGSGTCYCPDGGTTSDAICENLHTPPIQSWCENVGNPQACAYTARPVRYHDGWNADCTPKNKETTVFTEKTCRWTEGDDEPPEVLVPCKKCPEPGELEGGSYGLPTGFDNTGLRLYHKSDACTNEVPDCPAGSGCFYDRWTQQEEPPAQGWVPVLMIDCGSMKATIF